MTGHTPSLAQVRQLYANSMDPAGFDRWLTEERRAAAEKAYGEALMFIYANASVTLDPGIAPLVNPYRAKEVAPNGR